MIRNASELTFVRKQLALLESGLERLRRELLPKNNRNFKLYSEGYVDQIAELKAEIKTYRPEVKKNGKSRRPKAESGKR